MASFQHHHISQTYVKTVVSFLFCFFSALTDCLKLAIYPHHAHFTPNLRLKSSYSTTTVFHVPVFNQVLVLVPCLC